MCTLLYIIEFMLKCFLGSILILNTFEGDNCTMILLSLLNTYKANIISSVFSCPKVELYYIILILYFGLKQNIFKLTESYCSLFKDFNIS